MTCCCCFGLTQHDFEGANRRTTAAGWRPAASTGDTNGKQHHFPSARHGPGPDSPNQQKKTLTCKPEHKNPHVDAQTCGTVVVMVLVAQTPLHIARLQDPAPSAERWRQKRSQEARERRAGLQRRHGQQELLWPRVQEQLGPLPRHRRVGVVHGDIFTRQSNISWNNSGNGSRNKSGRWHRR